MGKQKYTEAQRRSAKKWDTKNLDRFSVAFPKGYKQKIKEAADARGESVNLFIKRAVEERAGIQQESQSDND